MLRLKRLFSVIKCEIYTEKLLLSLGIQFDLFFAQ